MGAVPLSRLNIYMSDRERVRIAAAHFSVLLDLIFLLPVPY